MQTCFKLNSSKCCIFIYDHVKVIILSVLEKACKDIFIVKHMGFMLHALGCFCLVCMYIYVCVFTFLKEALYI